MKNTLATELKYQRENKGMKQSDFEVDARTIIRIEKQNHIPKKSTLMQIENEIGISNGILTKYLENDNRANKENKWRFFPILRGSHLFEELEHEGKYRFDFSFLIEGGEKFNCMREFKDKVDELRKKLKDHHWDKLDFPNILQEWDMELGYLLAEMRRLDLGVFSKLYLVNDTSHNDYYYQFPSQYLYHDVFCFPLKEQSFIKDTVDFHINIPTHYLEIPASQVCYHKSGYSVDETKVILSEDQHFESTIKNYTVNKNHELTGYFLEFVFFKEKSAKIFNQMYKDDFFGDAINKDWYKMEYRPRYSTHTSIALGEECTSTKWSYWIWSILNDIAMDYIFHLPNCFNNNKLNMGEVVNKNTDKALFEYINWNYKQLENSSESITDYDKNIIKEYREKAKLIIDAFKMKEGLLKKNKSNPYFDHYLFATRKKINNSNGDL